MSRGTLDPRLYTLLEVRSGRFTVSLLTSLPVSRRSDRQGSEYRGRTFDPVPCLDSRTLQGCLDSDRGLSQVGVVLNRVSSLHLEDSEVQGGHTFLVVTFLFRSSKTGKG